LRFSKAGRIRGTLARGASSLAQRASLGGSGSREDFRDRNRGTPAAVARWSRPSWEIGLARFGLARRRLCEPRGPGGGPPPIGRQWPGTVRGTLSRGDSSTAQGAVLGGALGAVVWQWVMALCCGSRHNQRGSMIAVAQKAELRRKGSELCSPSRNRLLVGGTRAASDIVVRTDWQHRAVRGTRRLGACHRGSRIPGEGRRKAASGRGATTNEIAAGTRTGVS
jgi:hypothetical protein